MARFHCFARVAALLPGALLCACTAPSAPLCPISPPSAPVAWLVDQGWHTEIGLPTAAITGPLASFRNIFSGAAVLMFGFGKRTWMTAKVESAAELLMGPFPGPGAIQVVGIRTAPPAAYPDGRVIRLLLAPGQLARLSEFVRDSIATTSSGQPRLISQGLFAGSLFYAASQRYGPAYTCNSWTAQGLEAAGLAVRPKDVVFAAGVLDQTARLTQACRMQPRRLR